MKWHHETPNSEAYLVCLGTLEEAAAAAAAQAPQPAALPRSCLGSAAGAAVRTGLGEPKQQQLRDCTTRCCFEGMRSEHAVEAEAACSAAVIAAGTACVPPDQPH